MISTQCRLLLSLSLLASTTYCEARQIVFDKSAEEGHADFAGDNRNVRKLELVLLLLAVLMIHTAAGMSSVELKGCDFSDQLRRSRCNTRK